MRLHSFAFLCAAGLGVHVSMAQAEQIELPPAEIEVEPIAPAALGTGTATVISTEPRVGTATSLADLVATTAGAGVRRLGLPGSFAAISIRGLGNENVAVVLDDVLLTSASFGPTNLSTFPAAALDRLEIYRGSGPVRFEAPLGGVIRLVTRMPADRLELSAHAGYGAFSTRSTHASVGGALGAYRLALFAGYQGTAGDFRFYDDRNTLYTSADDAEVTRRNNASDAGFVRLAASRPGPAGGEWRLSLSGAVREEGSPGPGAVQTTATHAGTRELVGRLGLRDVSLAHGALRLAVGTDVLAAQRRFRDPRREAQAPFGDADTRLLRLGTDVRCEWLWNARHETELAPRFAWDDFNQVGTPLTPAGHRSTARGRLQAGAGLEHRADLGPLRLVPSVRVDAVYDTGDAIEHRPTQSAVSPRLGLVWFVEPCEVRANAGRFHRVPTTLERFGDGVIVKPNLNLVPERGVSSDAAASCAVAPFGIDLGAELAGFYTRTTGLIAYIQNGQAQVRAENLGDNRIAGLEGALRIASRYVRSALAYTLTDTEDTSGVAGFDGKRTPGIAHHRLHAALELGSRAYSVRYELTFASQTYLDRANVRPAPARLLHDVAAHIELGRGFAVKLSVTNLTDTLHEDVPAPGSAGRARVAKVDFLGYPLPGRAWFAALLWRNE